MQYSVDSKERTFDEKNESFLINSFCAVIFLSALNNFINCFFQIGLDTEIPYLTEAIYISMALLGCVSALKCFTKNLAVFFISVLIIGGCWISYLIYPELRTSIYDNPIDLIYNPINKVTFFCVPTLLYVSQIHNYEKLFNATVKWSRVTLIVGVLTFCYVYFVADKTLQYMVFSYFMLIPICVAVESYLQNRKKYDLIFVILGFFAILLCGARGAILSFFLYFIIRLVTYKGKSNTSVNLVTNSLPILIGLLVVFFWENILVWLYRLTEAVEINSRFITALIEGTLNESSGRDEIAAAIFKGVENNPFGYGFFGDRYTAGTFGASNFYYAHNVFLEVIASFGVVIGPLLMILFFIKLIKVLKNKNTYYNMMLWALIPYGIFQLFFSSSAIENLGFYAICALMFSKKAGGKR